LEFPNDHSFNDLSCYSSERKIVHCQEREK